MGLRWTTVALVLLFGCSVGDLDLANRSCPCVDGWVCDATDHCVPAGDAAVSADSAPPDASADAPADAPADVAPADTGGMCLEMPEVCNGEDDDCDTAIDEGICASATVYTSCAAALTAGETADGVYLLRPADGGPVYEIHCDMTTDEGGWTLVGSTRGTTFDDEASDYYGDLRTLEPAMANEGIWSGLRDLATSFDVRFTCRSDPGAAEDPFTVDLSFYDVIWYGEWTSGADADSCFEEGDDGLNADDGMPARRDNIADVSLPEGDPYTANSGFLEGEDECGDTGDFTIDFDDRGMDSNQSDGTDWGEDDALKKCGVNDLADGQWFVFARER